MIAFHACTQHLSEVAAVEIREIKTDFTEDEIAEFYPKENSKICEEIWEKLKKYQFIDDSLSESEREILATCDDPKGNPWSMPFLGCSWYCGGRIDSITSSNEKTAAFIHDSDYGTPWTSGMDSVEKSFIKFTFNPQSARLTDLIIVNGHAKSKELYRHYARAKKLKMYINNTPSAFLNLADNNEEQVFRFDPIGNKNPFEPKTKSRLKKWTITLEVLETYEGDVDEVAIAEIYFDGDHVDVE